MKRMVILCILLCLALSGCAKEASFSLCQPEDNINQVEVIWVYNWLTYAHTDMQSYEVVSVLPEEQHDAFLADIYQVPCYRYRNDPIEGFDQNTIRITYADGAVQLIGARSVYYETADGTWEYPPYYFAIEDFEDCVSKYCMQ